MKPGKYIAESGYFNPWWRHMITQSFMIEIVDSVHAIVHGPLALSPRSACFYPSDLKGKWRLTDFYKGWVRLVRPNKGFRQDVSESWNPASCEDGVELVGFNLRLLEE